jgi:hypothetical protein
VAIQLLAAASVVLTAVYAWLTFRILQANRATVKVMQEQSAALTRPYVAISAEADRGSIVFLLKISNRGKTAAERVSLAMDRSFYQFGDPDKNIQSMNAFVGVMATMPPGFELTFHLGTSIQIYGGGTRGVMPQAFNITATYSSSDGRHFVETTIVDLRALYQTAVIEDRVAEQLKQIAESIKALQK